MLKSLLLLVIFLCPLLAWCNERNSREVLIGISFSIPPYVIQEENNGLELAILRQSFAAKGYSVLTSYLPLARTLLNFQDGSLDGVINVREGSVNGFYSDIVITFRNYAVTLKERNIKIDSLEDLSRKGIVAFQRATNFLEPEFEAIVRNNSEYEEVADQSQQIKRLFKYRTEVIVLEEKIFKYYRKQIFERSITLGARHIISETEIRKPVVFHDVFAPSEYRFAFLSKKVRDDFNEGLRLIRSNGVYADIMSKYDEDLELPPKDRTK